LAWGFEGDEFPPSHGGRRDNVAFGMTALNSICSNPHHLETPMGLQLRKAMLAMGDFEIEAGRRRFGASGRWGVITGRQRQQRRSSGLAGRRFVQQRRKPPLGTITGPPPKVMPTRLLDQGIRPPFRTIAADPACQFDPPSAHDIARGKARICSRTILRRRPT